MRNYSYRIPLGPDNTYHLAVATERDSILSGNAHGLLDGETTLRRVRTIIPQLKHYHVM